MLQAHTKLTLRRAVMTSNFFRLQALSTSPRLTKDAETTPAGPYGRVSVDQSSTGGQGKGQPQSPASQQSKKRGSAAGNAQDSPSPHSPSAGQPQGEKKEPFGPR